MDDSIEFQLSVQDSQANAEELQAILRTLAAELESQSAVVESVASPDSSTPDGTVAMGEPSSSILDVKINMDSLKAFGKWLYERLLGTNTKVKFEYGEAKFEFEGRNDRDRAAAQQDFEAFVAKLEAAKLEAMKQAKHG